ncbi:RagB/SusD family nutrient uptake outer membrane protein [Fulvivirgaceae bacterium PWU4]|uniref:RagB/SusD family nutrient uptake outer membrane protein n=1 Tax=Chryseosolibacter histidini TaxID=2782349 RepID=A0AAP2DIL6_9BACT|nr:RagB/SusD family nutrient uptake outer membrane protein [Chryseosolibacter histidini]MBT1696995.1 RagB/SusD family nutrient uptake outer membrane protein [Chryseosolibacter histidini]
MNRKNISFKNIFIALSVLVLASCSLDIDNPNGPTDEQVLNSRDGLITHSVGMRNTYSTLALESIILNPGATAHELRGITTFTNVIEIDQGGTALPNFNGNITGVWQRPLRVMAMAEDIIAKAPTVLATDPAMLSGVMSHAKLFKAMTLGALAQSFTHGVLNTDKSGSATFAPRETLLATAITLLKEADAALTATPPSAEFTSRVTGAEFNLPNTIRAYLARYSLMAGNYADAIAAAQSVNLTVASSFIFTNLAPNPLYQQIQVSKNFAARDQFGLPPALVEAGDGRLAFYFTTNTATHQGDPIDNLTGFATAIDKPIPVYLPDEMRLIIAEALIRSNGSIPDAIVQINAVRTQTTGDPFGVHAGLGAYMGAITTDALLTEIYKQRSAELYLSGLRLEDSRRFGRPEPPTDVNPVPMTSERSRNFYPFPLQERQNNINTPADPTI